VYHVYQLRAGFGASSDCKCDPRKALVNLLKLALPCSHLDSNRPLQPGGDKERHGVLGSWVVSNIIERNTDQAIFFTRPNLSAF
jgi:hypothetical protein